MTSTEFFVRSKTSARTYIQLEPVYLRAMNETSKNFLDEKIKPFILNDELDPCPSLAKDLLKHV